MCPPLSMTVAVLTVSVGGVCAQTLQFASTNYTVNEFNQFTTVIIERQGSVPSAPAQINAEDGTAVKGRDYLTPINQPEFGFSPNFGQAVSARIQVPIVDNPNFDGPRTFLLKLVNPANGVVIGSRSNAVVTILDDDTVVAPGRNINEGIGIIRAAPDGKWLIGGRFNSVDGQRRNQIARLNRDGTVDASFAPGLGPDGAVHTLAYQPDGKLLVGGTFTNWGVVKRVRVARLNSDGSLDTSFDPGSVWFGVLNSNKPPSDVRSIALQADGRILIAGNGTDQAGIEMVSLIRVNSDGLSDATFTSTQRILKRFIALGIQADGKIIVGGEADSAWSRFIRLNANGSLDDPFFGAISGLLLNALLVQPDGGIWIGGAAGGDGFGLLRPVPKGQTSSVQIAHQGEILKSGTVFALASQPDSKVLVAGVYRGENPGQYPLVLRFNSDGTVDTSFSLLPWSQGNIYALAVQSDGEIGIASECCYLGFPINFALSQFRRLNPSGMLINDLRLDKLVRLPNGQVHGAFRGQFTGGFVIQASADFVNWEAIFTNFFPNSQLNFIDPQAANRAQGFYRVRPWP
jgi:uncharacterized delta-60 repeat protein